MTPIGSSSITTGNSIGPQGATGFTGPDGVTGNTGNIGDTGATGATGIHVVSAENDYPYLNLNMSDGSVIGVEGVLGNPGELGTASGINNSYLTIFKEVSDGITFWFKGITCDGSISLYSTDGVIGISGDVVYQESNVESNINLDADRILYISPNNKVTSSGITYDNKLLDLTDATLDIEENITRVFEINKGDIVGITGGSCTDCLGGTAGDGTGIQLDVYNNSIIKVLTPNGIAGFTGDFDSSEMFSFTMILSGNSLWDWPENIYFDSNNISFSCGEDIINFITTDGGVRWNATISSFGYTLVGAECLSLVDVGSCCYTDVQEQRQCIEYTTKDICEEKNDGTWFAGVPCDANCGATADGICCSQGGNWGTYSTTGVCVQGEGLDECNYFGGSFWNYYYYKESLVEGGEDIFMERLETPVPIECGGHFPCLDENDSSCVEGEGVLRGTIFSNQMCATPCEKVSCCKDGRCVGDSIGTTTAGHISPVVCRYVFGGVPVEGECGDIDCCDYSTVIGACCLESLEICQQGTHSSCVELNGIFMGPDSHCEDEPCCYDNFEGLCCLNREACNCCNGFTGGNCCQNKTKTDCEMIGGEWQEGECPDPDIGSCQCGSSDECIPESGACCILGENGPVCLDDVRELSCEGMGGDYRGNESLCGDADICYLCFNGTFADPITGECHTCGTSDDCPVGQCCYQDQGGEQPTSSCYLCPIGCPPENPDCHEVSCGTYGDCSGPDNGCCNGICRSLPCDEHSAGCCYLAGGGMMEGVSQYACDFHGGDYEGGEACDGSYTHHVPALFCGCDICRSSHVIGSIEGATKVCAGGTLILEDGTWSGGAEWCGCGSDACTATQTDCDPPDCDEGKERCEASDGQISEGCCDLDTGKCHGTECCDANAVTCDILDNAPEYLKYQCCPENTDCCGGVDPVSGNPQEYKCCRDANDEHPQKCCGGKCYDIDTECCTLCNCSVVGLAEGETCCYDRVCPAGSSCVCGGGWCQCMGCPWCFPPSGNCEGWAGWPGMIPSEGSCQTPTNSQICCMNGNTNWDGGVEGCNSCCFTPELCGGGPVPWGCCDDCDCDRHRGGDWATPPEEVPNTPDNPDTIFGEYLINGRCEWIWCDIPCEYSECNTED